MTTPELRTLLAHPVPDEDPGFSVGRVAVVTIAVVIALRLAGPATGLGWVLIAGALGLSLACCTSPAAAGGSALLAWSLGDGFWAHRLGELHAGTVDLAAAAALCAVAALSCALARRALPRGAA